MDYKSPSPDGAHNWAEILWDFKFQTDKQLLANQPDIVVADREPWRAVVTDAVIPADSAIRGKKHGMLRSTRAWRNNWNRCGRWGQRQSQWQRSNGGCDPPMWESGSTRGRRHDEGCNPRNPSLRKSHTPPWVGVRWGLLFLKMVRLEVGIGFCALHLLTRFTEAPLGCRKLIILFVSLFLYRRASWTDKEKEDSDINWKSNSQAVFLPAPSKHISGDSSFLATFINKKTEEKTFRLTS